MTRHALPSALIVLLTVATVVPAQSRPPGESGSGGMPPRDRGKIDNRGRARSKPKGPAVLQVLRTRIDEVEWEDRPLDDVFEWLEEQGPINVVVMWRALEALGITRDTPVTLRMRSATVAQILNAVLEQVSDEGLLRYRGQDAILKISTREAFNRKLHTRIYDVADLVLPIPTYDGPDVTILGGGGGGFGGGGGGFGGGSGGFGGGGFGGGSGGFGGGGFSGGGAGGGATEKSVEEQLDELVELIKNTIEPDTWVDNGGRGTIRVWRQTLVIRNNVEVHEQIGGPFYDNDF